MAVYSVLRNSSQTSLKCSPGPRSAVHGENRAGELISSGLCADVVPDSVPKQSLSARCLDPDPADLAKVFVSKAPVESAAVSDHSVSQPTWSSLCRR